MTDQAKLPVTLNALEPLPQQVVDVLLANGFKVVAAQAFIEFTTTASALAKLMPNYKNYADNLNENDLGRVTVHNGGVMVLGITVNSIQDGYSLQDFPLFKGGLVTEEAKAALKALGIPLAPFEAVASQVTAPAPAKTKLTPQETMDAAKAFCTKHLAEISADILASRQSAPEPTGRYRELVAIYRKGEFHNSLGMAESTTIALALELAAGQLKPAA